MYVPQLTQRDLAHAVLQIAANPLMLTPVTRLGEDAMLTILDSSRYAALGEELNFWQLMVSRVFHMRPVISC
jgi:hypothetical protein